MWPSEAEAKAAEAERVAVVAFLNLGEEMWGGHAAIMKAAASFIANREHLSGDRER